MTVGSRLSVRLVEADAAVRTGVQELHEWLRATRARIPVKADDDEDHGDTAENQHRLAQRLVAMRELRAPPIRQPSAKQHNRSGERSVLSIEVVANCHGHEPAAYRPSALGVQLVGGVRFVRKRPNGHSGRRVYVSGPSGGSIDPGHRTHPRTHFDGPPDCPPFIALREAANGGRRTSVDASGNNSRLGTPS